MSRVDALSPSGQCLRMEGDWMMKKSSPIPDSERGNLFLPPGESLLLLSGCLIVSRIDKLHVTFDSQIRIHIDIFSIPGHFRLCQPPVRVVPSSTGLSRPPASQWCMKALVEGVNLAGNAISRQDLDVSIRQNQQF
jgi:hypothetical protein